MTALWTIDDMAKAMGAEKSGVLPNAVPGLSIDSRGLAKGEAFFAIKATIATAMISSRPRSKPAPALR